MSRESKDEFAGLKLSGRYEVQHEIGRGGMASVYIATDERLGRDVAIKFPSRELFEFRETRERFEKEIRRLTKLDHKAIVKVLDVGKEGDQPFVVMQYLAGGTLSSRLRAGAKERPPQDVLDWLVEIASALDYTHSKGIIHRDVKPSNVLFDTAGGAFLSDFGIAKAIGPSTTNLTISGQSPGTPLYMGPEIAGGKAIGPQYDQYALGIMTYQALSGRFPHEGSSPIEVMVKRKTESPRPLREVRRDVPSAVAAAVMRSLAPDPDDRFKSCSAFVEAFASACGTGLHFGPSGTRVDPQRARMAGRESGDETLAEGPSNLRTTPIPQGRSAGLLRSRKARAVAVATLVVGLLATATVVLWPRADGDARRLRAAIDGRPALPDPKPDATPDGYRRAVAFLAAKKSWGEANPGLDSRLRDAPEMKEWNAAADAIATLRDEADHLELELDDPATRRVTDRRVEVRGRLKSGRLGLLELRPTLSWKAGDREGVLLEVVLPSDAKTVELEFRRLNGDKLASEGIEFEPPPDPNIARLLKERRAFPSAARVYTSAGFEAAKQFDEKQRAWQRDLDGQPEAVAAAVARDPEAGAWETTTRSIHEFLSGVVACKLVLDAADVLEVAERTATVELGSVEGDRRYLDVAALPPAVTVVPTDGAQARLLVQVALPDGAESIDVGVKRIDGTVLGSRTIRLRAAAPTPAPTPAPVNETPTVTKADPAVALRDEKAGFEKAWPKSGAFDEWRRKVGQLPDESARNELLAGALISRLLQRAQLGLGDGFAPDPKNQKASAWLHERSGLVFLAIDMTGGTQKEENPAAQVQAADVIRPDRNYLLVSETECTNDAWYRRWKQQPVPDGQDEQAPVVRIRLVEIAGFCSSMELDLPTIDEWQTVARSGSGDDRRVRLPSPDLDRHAWYRDVAQGRISRVRGDRAPNGVGLYDLVGNAAEMCISDDFAGKDWRAAARSGEKVSRSYLGGSFQSSRKLLIGAAKNPRTNHGFDLLPEFDDGEVDKGFRPVFRPQPKKG